MSTSLRVIPLVAVVALLGAFCTASAAIPPYSTVPATGTHPGVSAPWEPDWPSASLAPTNVNVSSEAGAQSETSVAVDPTDANHILASVNDLGAGLPLVVWESFDAGTTWTRTVIPGANAYDTWLTFNSAGDAFLSYEYGNESIAYKDHGTSTWVNLFGIPVAGAAPDRDNVACDRGASAFAGSVYVGYDDNGAGNTAYVLYSRTGKGSASWSRSALISDTGPTIGVNAAVGPDGTVYATWLEYGASALRTDKSTDGGATWGADHTVTNLRANTAGFWIYIPPQNDRGIVLMPFTTVAQSGPFAGRLYCAYTDYRTGTQTAIYIRYSDDGGATWSPEVLLSGNARYAFHPNVAVLADGTVGVNFYITSGKGKNATRKTTHSAAFSHDGGATWTAVQSVASATSDETGVHDANQYGDYQNISASPAGTFAIVWTDSRSGNQAEELYFANMTPALAPQVVTTATKDGAARVAPDAAPVASAAAPVTVMVARGGAGSSSFDLTLANEGSVEFTVFNAAGRAVRHVMNGIALPGEYHVNFDGRDDEGRALPSGVFLYRVISGVNAAAGRFVIAR